MSADDFDDLSLNNDGYCELCRQNLYQNTKGHIYSKKHQKVISDIFLKCDKKMATAHAVLKTPAVDATTGSDTATFWCYFCGREDRLHEMEGHTRLIHGGLVHHLTSPSHSEHLDKFWIKHRLKKPKEKYKLEEECWKKYQEMSQEAVEKFLFQKHVAIKKEANRIAKQEHARHLVLTSNVHPPMRATYTADVEPSSSGQASTMHITAAPDAGVTAIKLPKLSGVSGNVHSGAKPPWLQESTDESPSNATIGPTEEDLKKHLAAEKKAKLPANRVRSKVMAQKDSANWLPSFGRVWNKNRRLNSRQQFLRKSRPQSSQSSLPVAPYKPKSSAPGQSSGHTASAPQDSSPQPNCRADQLHSHRASYSSHTVTQTSHGDWSPPVRAGASGLPGMGRTYPANATDSWPQNQGGHQEDHHSSRSAWNQSNNVYNVSSAGAYRSKRQADANNSEELYPATSQVLKKSRIKISQSFL